MLRPCVARTVGKNDHRILSEADWFVVGLARKDGPISLNPDSGFCPSIEEIAA